MRYIDPYQLADKVAESMRDNPHEGKIALNHRLEHEHFLRMIALAPDADVEPVVHARWIVKFDDRGWKKHSCSGCGYFRRTDVHVSLNWHYCPNCAAKRGRYSLNLSYSDWDSVVAERVCENLKGLGYKACPDVWRAAIYISWRGEE